MPYKDPERKRQWEREHREHREQRNAARRLSRVVQVRQPIPPKRIIEPTPKDEKGSGWGVVGLFVGLALVIVATFAGIRIPDNLPVTGRARL
jgi:ferric-dicitrate binding protein FerR (iron transport regulator)